MRVLVVIPDPDLPELHLLEGLAARTDLMVIASPDSPRFASMQHIPGVRPVRFRSRLDGEARRTIERAVREHVPDIIHCFSSRSLSNTLAATRRVHVPIVVYRGTMGRVSRFDPTSWLSYLHPRVSGYLCVSEAVRQYLLRFGIAPWRARTIYKGHRCEWYRPAPRSQLEALGLHQSHPVIACVANARPVKGVDILVRAFSLLHSGNAQLLLIGQLRDSKLSRLIDQSARKDRIYCTGFRSDAPALVGASDLFVMPSREREGLPKAVIEAMAQCVPVLVTRVGGMPELVLDGESGVVVPPGDVRQLAAAIDALIEDPERRRALGENGRRRIERHFTPEHTLEETLEFYRAICSAKQG